MASRPSSMTGADVAQERLQHLLRRPFEGWPPGEPFTPWPEGAVVSTAALEPAADVEETHGAFVIEVDLPGVAKSDVKVEHAGRRITILAERRERDRSGTLRISRRLCGRFRLDVDLPCDTAETGVGAALADGVLTVRVPKLEPVAPRHIPVA